MTEFDKMILFLEDQKGTENKTDKRYMYSKIIKRLSSTVSLRQHYAGLAMQGLARKVHAEYLLSVPSDTFGDAHVDNIAVAAFKIADAMLKQEAKDV